MLFRMVVLWICVVQLFVAAHVLLPRLVRSLPRRRRRLPRVRRALERARWPYVQDGLAWRVAAGSELNAMRQLRRSLCGEFAQQEGRLSWVVGSVITEKPRPGGYHCAEEGRARFPLRARHSQSPARDPFREYLVSIGSRASRHKRVPFNPDYR